MDQPSQTPLPREEISFKNNTPVNPTTRPTPTKGITPYTTYIEKIPVIIRQTLIDYATNRAITTALISKCEHTLNKRQAIIDSLELPKNSSKELQTVFKSAQTDSQKRTIIELATLTMDKTTRLTEYHDQIKSYSTKMFEAIIDLHAKAQITVVPYSQQEITGLHDAIYRYIRDEHVAKEFADNKKKEEKAAAAAAAATLKASKEPDPNAPVTAGDLAKLLEKAKKEAFLEAKQFFTKRTNRFNRPHQRRSTSQKRSQSRSRSRSRSRQRAPTKHYTKGPKVTFVKSALKRRSPSPFPNREGKLQLPSKNKTRSKTPKTLKPKSLLVNPNKLPLLLPHLPTINNNGFTNLATSEINENISKYLGYGLQFIPIPSTDIEWEDIHPSFQKLTDRLNWQYHFQNTETQNNNYTKETFYKQLHKEPTPYNGSTHFQLKTGLYHLEKQLKDAIQNNTPIPSNTPTVALIHKIKRLKTDTPNIKFIRADKNLGLVAIDTLDYHKLVMQHLNNNTIYKDYGLIHETYIKLADLIVTTHQDLQLAWKNVTLTKQMTKFLKKVNTTIPPFHITAKVHKTPLKGRPIVGAVNWITTSSSKVLDILLQKYLVNDPYILPNSTELTKDWYSQSFNINTDWLVSLDVTSLYTNINITHATQTINNYNTSLGAIAKIIMETNYFHYNNILYHQLDGIAMGTNCAVAIANLYLKDTDTKLATYSGVRLYKRYIDDVGLIFTGTESELKDFITYSNSITPGINFTAVYSKDSLDILDITFYNKNNIIEFKTYQKEINRYLYIPPFSNHPPSTIKGFIKGELTRYTRTNSNITTLNSIKSQFHYRLINRGYKPHYLEKIFNPYPKFINNTINYGQTITKIILPIPYRKNSTRTRAIISNLKKLADPNGPSLFPDFIDTTIITTVYSTLPNTAKLLLKSALTITQSNFINNRPNDPKDQETELRNKNTYETLVNNTFRARATPAHTRAPQQSFT
jgi:hypothetical protein